MKIFALVTNQGTACSETALCENCLNTTNTTKVRQSVKKEVDIDFSSFIDCSGNDALECVECGGNNI